jgi:hypothetical protein
MKAPAGQEQAFLKWQVTNAMQISEADARQNYTNPL